MVESFGSDFICFDKASGVMILEKEVVSGMLMKPLDFAFVVVYCRLLLWSTVGLGLFTSALLLVLFLTLLVVLVLFLTLLVVVSCSLAC